MGDLFGYLFWIVVIGYLLLAFFFWHPIVFLGILAPLSYYFLQKSNFVYRLARKSREAAAAREEEHLRLQIIKEWQTTDYVPPTRKEFVQAILDECRQKSSLNLRHEVLQPILSHVGWLYEHFGTENKHLPIATTKLQIEGFQSCVTLGIRAFIEKAPQLLEPPPQPPTPFTSSRTLSQLIGRDPAEALEGAYAALVEDITDMKQSWQRIGLMDVYHGPEEIDDKPPDMDTYIDIHIPPGEDWTQAKMDKVKSAHAKLVRDYDKRLEKRNQDLPPLQRAFLGTAFWNAADWILPTDAKFEDPIAIPDTTRFAGTWIIAPSGQGKTNLMWHLIDADRKRRGTVVIMDSKGTLLNCKRRS